MAKRQLDDTQPAVGGGQTPSAMTLAELKALRDQQREMSRRIEELKLRLFQMSERNIEKTVWLIKTWVKKID